ncbi:unnamed protein product [Rotaria sordida]|uniref:Carbamoyl-phosphate synthetase large subunit oligomerisation domain-containing protein n=1 Tax=Rotaria sordida TaxID=392033 RepID=A0A814GHN9_9BILA|nr:unnamed protein product [Rotaria sordida]CAF0996477.1 unnamed protein product [Rotaria sordida]CAF1347848.1 unnamed protein product [Rotaria sordida]CAF3795184.1 unnamed protein product [Rotaria sordida]CAF3894176.1 unnamed protein product [Rotaria sordida]
MENIDPTASHTDESIVVVPSQTLSSDEFNLLRSVSIKVVRHLGIVGQCNIQFSLNPLCIEYYIIKVNACLIRSSALALKATGYSLGYITAKLALGMNLVDLKNLKSVEVMTISKSFDEAFQKCLRMVDQNFTGFDSYARTITDNEISALTDVNVFILATAFHQGYTIERFYQLTQIDRWFLYQFQAIIQFLVHRFNSSIIQDRALLKQNVWVFLINKLPIPQIKHFD